MPELDNVRQTLVYLEVVESSARAMFLIGIGIAVYNIADAEDKAWQTGREASNIIGASDRQAGEFLKRFTGVLGTDEAALAIARHDEIGMGGDRVNAIFRAMDESYNNRRR